MYRRRSTVFTPYSLSRMFKANAALDSATRFSALFHVINLEPQTTLSMLRPTFSRTAATPGISSGLRSVHWEMCIFDANLALNMRQNVSKACLFFFFLRGM
ncbi:hypothetical protein CHARACLAT_020670 [Characodon lateralis]|uniref:Uncharacterized protein n=1 Tax=Characodon lateralis TaxID=208331 RepID=A0ABU7CT85_9TELE|nr:hypothetical protein [Characodon lateralis]